jgi:thioredoxin reductase (NADPH)
VSDSVSGEAGRGPWATGWRSASDVRTDASAMKSTQDRPAIVVVDDDDGPGGDVLVRSLKRRYGNDYEVLAASEPGAAIATLMRLRDHRADVALIVAGQSMTAETGTAFLARTRDDFPTARRLVVTRWSDQSALPTIARAATLGEIDHQANVPWNETDEQFLALVGGILADWALELGRSSSGITIVSERSDAQGQALADVLERWGGTPVGFVEAETAEGLRLVAGLAPGDRLPVAVLSDGRILARPSLSEVAEAFGANAEPLSTPFDVAILGSGPAGLSAAVNLGSEGLRVVLVEPSIGQAGSSPMIRNFLGFPSGLSGAELLRRAWQQAWMFGVHARIGRGAKDIRTDGDDRIVLLDDGSEAHARAIVLAMGASHRRTGIQSVERLVGRGVFYGPGATEAQAMAGEPVAVVGGGNSAAQSAIHLARYADRVTLLVRGSSLAGGVSEYLVEQLDDLPNVEVRLNSEIVEAHDGQWLRSLMIRDNATGTVAEREATGLFILIGAEPRTEWLPAAIARDERGFVLTGEDAPPVDRSGRVRLPLETMMPGVFAIGDVRHGSIKRVAAAVGEGATASPQVQLYSSETQRSARAS